MRLRTAVVAAVVGGLAVLGPLAWLRGWAAPVVGTLAGAVSPAGRASADEPEAVLREQVVRLGAENAVLRGRLAEYGAIEGEGKATPERVVVARGRVIGRTRRASRRFIELDVGRVDGVVKGMAVAMGWTLVGQVSGTDDGRCLVQEITDGESRVAAAVVDPGDAARAPVRLCEGVLAGRGRRDLLGLEFIETSPELALTPGLGVITAGSDGRFPAGLVLGAIRSASHAGGEAWQVEVAPSRDPELAESLLVLRFDR